MTVPRSGQQFYLKESGMGIERRRAPREEKNVRISVVVDEREMPANLANISRVGALVRVESADCGLSDLDIGKSVSLVMQAEKSKIKQPGVICRYTEDGPRKYLAVDFNHHLFS
jgi:hypothetical protein